MTYAHIIRERDALQQRLDTFAEWLRGEMDQAERLDSSGTLATRAAVHVRRRTLREVTLAFEKGQQT